MSKQFYCPPRGAATIILVCIDTYCVHKHCENVLDLEVYIYCQPVAEEALSKFATDAGTDRGF
jgi:hypothetical protein